MLSEEHEWKSEASISTPQSNASIWRFAGSMNSVDAIVSCTGFGHADTLLTTASLVSTVGDASFEGVSGSIGSDINVSRDSRIAAPAVETVESTEIDLIFSVLFAVAVVALVVAGSNVLVLFVLLVAVLVVLVRAVLTVPVSTVVFVLAEDCAEQHATEKLHPSTLKYC